MRGYNTPPKPQTQRCNFGLKSGVPIQEEKTWCHWAPRRDMHSPQITSYDSNFFTCVLKSGWYGTPVQKVWAPDYRYPLYPCKLLLCQEPSLIFQSRVPIVCLLSAYSVGLNSSSTSGKMSITVDDLTLPDPLTPANHYLS